MGEKLQSPHNKKQTKTKRHQHTLLRPLKEKNKSFIRRTRVTRMNSMSKGGPPSPAAINKMTSAGFVYLGLAKFLLPTAQALPKPMLSFPELQQAKNLTKWKKSMKDTHFQTASPLCAQREMPLHGGQLGFGPADQLLCRACQSWQQCPSRTVSAVPRKVVQLEVVWGCSCHRKGKELG